MNWSWKKDKETVTTLYYQGRTQLYSNISPQSLNIVQQTNPSNAEETKQSYNTTRPKRAVLGIINSLLPDLRGKKQISG